MYLIVCKFKDFKKALPCQNAIQSYETWPAYLNCDTSYIF
jgi:hypothetical protein